MLLDKGQEDDWFGSHFIVTLIVISATCLISLVIWEWFNKAPIIDVRLFKNFNFAVSNMMMFFLGLMLFSSLVMMPQFLQTLLGYTAQSAGLVLSGSGVVLLIEMPIIGQLTSKYPAKYIISFGWLVLCCAMYYSTQRLDLSIGFRSAAWLRVAQGAGLGFLFVPITLACYIGIPPEKSNSVAGIVNFMRNIGSSVGTSMVTTLLARRAQVHQTNLVYHATNFDPEFRNQLNGISQTLLQAGLSAPDARRQAMGRLYQSVVGQAQTLAYIDTFMILAIGAGIMFVLSFIIRKNDPGGGGEVAVG